MGDGDSIAKHLNAFNIIVTHFISVGVKMDEKDNCMNFFVLCSIHGTT